MSLTLGEKLRQAREERGISLNEVADQTRISGHYLEAIENDDYRTLPGGIFNKGFVKSFAKYVDVDEQEALRDYASLISAAEAAGEEPLKPYKPEVLTDDRSGSSMIPTVIVAVIILGLMTAGVLYLVDYLRNQPATPAPVANTNPQPGSNTNTANSNAAVPTAGVPDMATLKIEFKALNEPVSLSATADGKMSTNVVTPGTTVPFEPKESLKLSYSRSLAQAVQLTINGKAITLPAVPFNPKRNVIEFEITKENLAQIWNSGAISNEVPGATPDANANVAGVPTPGTSVPPVSRPTPAAKPSTETNTATPPANRPAATPKPATPDKPATPPAKPASNKP